MKTKKQLLKQFSKEYSTALKLEIDLFPNIQDTPSCEAVLDKYMNMNVELFDADDLNEIVDQIELKTKRNENIV